MPTAACLIACWFILMPNSGQAHGEVHIEIEAITAQLKITPDLAELYLRRAQLYRRDRDWPAAAADLDRAAQLNPALTVVELARGETLADSGRHEEAMVALDRFLEREPKHAAGFSARAHAHLLAMRPAEAAADLERAIAFTPKPEPSLHIERARALQSAGQLDEAIRALDAGIARHGPLVTLLQAALEMEEQAGRFDAARARIDALLETTPRKERWLARRGALLEKQGDREAARAAYVQAKGALAEAPATRRSTAAMVTLAGNIDAALQRLGEP
ncbi:MAG TPA: tetratricopeptide repeat protein [Chthoniobacteraceae bacterium]|nr:tetratricopeptide repeat protein [Chthoniobacteraceae bacterium]